METQSRKIILTKSLVGKLDKSLGRLEKNIYLLGALVEKHNYAHANNIQNIYKP